MSNGTIAVLGGAGTMGTALIDGLIAVRECAPGAIVATARHRRSLEELASREVRTTTNNKEAVAGASIVVLSVHPENLEEVSAEVRSLLEKEALVVSIVTGATTALLERRLGDTCPVIRATPNIAALAGASMTALCRGRRAGRSHVASAMRIFGTVGRVIELDECHMDSCTGLAGCGPAFAFKIIEALAAGGVKMGLPRDAARVMAAQVLRGAAEMVLKTGRHPAELKDDVTTPGGCTIDGITKLEERGLPIALIEAVEVSTRKAGFLGDAGG